MWGSTRRGRVGGVLKYMHCTFNRTKSSILLPCSRQRRKCTLSCFKAIFLAIAIEQEIPFSQTRTKLYNLLRKERKKTIPCLAAHPRILGHIREYPPPPGGIRSMTPRDLSKLLSKMTQKRKFHLFKYCIRHLQSTIRLHFNISTPAGMYMFSGFLSVTSMTTTLLCPLFCIVHIFT